MPLPCKFVDVFSAVALRGNPVAVVLGADALDGASMQAIAHWTNLSETAFLLRPTQPRASYRLRIFTPRQELPFADHPSVGAAHAALEAGVVKADDGSLLQECAAGLLPVRVHEHGDARGAGRRIFVQAPAARVRDTPAQANAALLHALGGGPAGAHGPRIVDNGPAWWLVDLACGQRVRALQPDLAAIASLCSAQQAVGVAAFGSATGPDHDLVIRCFCPADGIPEDPVTGSANAAVAAHLAATGALPAAHYRASQGREMGRDGIVELLVEGAQIWLGGAARTVIDGSLSV